MPDCASSSITSVCGTAISLCFSHSSVANIKFNAAMRQLNPNGIRLLLNKGCSSSGCAVCVSHPRRTAQDGEKKIKRVCNKTGQRNNRHGDERRIRMPGAVFALVDRLEAFFETCAKGDYEPDLAHRVLLFLSLLPVFAFVVVTFLSWTDRSLFNWFLAAGLYTNSFVIWALQQGVPFLSEPAACSTGTRSRPADDAATMSFVLLHYFVFYVRSAKVVQSDVPGWLSVAVLLACAILTNYSVVQLGIYTIPEVILGSLIGGVNALILANILYRVVAPLVDSAVLATLAHFLRVHSVLETRRAK